MIYDDPLLTLQRNGSSIASSGLGPGPITPVSTTFLIGSGLQDAIIRDVELVSSATASPTLQARYGFDALYQGELVASDPTYSGIFNDYSSNALLGTYTFTRDQSAFTVSVGALTLTTAPSIAALPTALLDILGIPLASSIFTASAENVNSPGFSLIGGSAGDLGAPRVFYWVMVMSAIGLFLAAVVYAYMKNVALAITAAGLPLAYGTMNFGIPGWWMAVWIALWVVVLGSQNWAARE